MSVCESVDELVGGNVGRLRRDRGLTAVALAVMLGLSEDALAEAEAGQRRLNANQLYTLSQSLGVEVSELFAPLEAATVVPIR